MLAGIDDLRVTITEHAVNRGKGAAVRTAAALATGDYLVIFDADLEYSPDDILGLLTPVTRGDADGCRLVVGGHQDRQLQPRGFPICSLTSLGSRPV